MTDRELLENAAKAMGSDFGELNGRFVEVRNGEVWAEWNPLESDGDAFRLMVKLGLLVDCISHCARSLSDDSGWQEGSGPDACANTRLAIFRAAVEIGRAMEREGKCSPCGG